MEYVANRVKETISAVSPATTAATTSVTLAGAYDASFQTFNNAFGTIRSFPFTALDGNNWQSGSAYLSASTVLQITEVNASSSGNNAIALSTNAVFWCDTPAKYFTKLKGMAFAASKSYGMP